MRKNMDLTVGPIGWNLFLFAVPLFVSSLVQQLYSTVDLIYVGNLFGKTASSAVGASSPLIACMVNFFTGLAVGAGVTIAQAFGRRDISGIRRSMQSAMALGIYGGLVFAICGYIAAPWLLRLIETPKNLMPDATGYLRVYFLSFVSVVTYNMAAGILRAMGDARTPLLAQLCGGILNIGLNALFIWLLPNGILAVGWATLVCQTLAAGIVLCQLTHLEPDCALQFRQIRFFARDLRKILSIGLPAGIQASVISLSNVLIQHQINLLDVDAIAAFAAYFKVELLVYLPSLALGQALMTFTGQNLGAEKPERIRLGTRTALLGGIGLTVFLSGLSLLFGEPLFRIFNQESEVIALGQQIIAVSYPFYFLYTIMTLLADTLRGEGYARVPMLLVILNICLLRIGLLHLLPLFLPNLQALAAVFPLTWGSNSLCMAIYYRTVHKKNPLPH